MTKISGVAVAVVMACALFFQAMPAAHADVQVMDKQQAKTAIDAVLNGPDFGRRVTDTEWRIKRDRNKKPDEPAGAHGIWSEILATLGEGLLWVAAAAAVVYIIFRLPRWLRWVRRARSETAPAAAPRVLFGLDVSGEDLPSNIEGAVRDLIERGEIRLALGLLYRASLVVLIQRDGTPFLESYTEQQCVEALRHQRNDAVLDFFVELTRHWQRLAYGHITPERQALQALCSGWGMHFGGAP